MIRGILWGVYFIVIGIIAGSVAYKKEEVRVYTWGVVVLSSVCVVTIIFGVYVMVYAARIF